MNKTNSAMKINTKEFCEKIPKIELHAHLNGSLNEDILRQLGCSDDSIEEYQKLANILNKSTRTLEECFGLFKVAHNATKTQENLYLATQSVIRDFDSENTIYLELRTTPRSEEDMSKEEYIETVVRAIKDCKNIYTVLVKLILSIDRRQDVQTARDSLDVILKMKEKHPEVIKGLDLSGDPNVGNFDVNLFEKARQSGLKISIHCAEVKNDEEVKNILEFVPDRLGHCVFLHPDYNGSVENWNIYLEKKIPMECCLTSNITCGIIEKYEAHHIRELIKLKLPFSICTDDKGVFRTTLSNEYEQVMKHFDISPKRLYQYVCETVQQCFASDEEKKQLLLQLQEYYQAVLQDM